MYDPNFSTVRLLLHAEEGVAGSTVVSGSPLNEAGAYVVESSSTGVTYTSTAPVFGNRQFGFGGGGAYMRIYEPSPIIEPNQPWTFECWLTVNNKNVDGDVMEVGGDLPRMCGVSVQDGDLVLRPAIGSEDTSTVAITSGVPVHIAMTRDAVGAPIKLYVGGTLAASVANFSLEDPGFPGYYVSFGMSDYWFGTSFAGRVDEARFSAMARYTGNFTVPTEPFGGQPPDRYLDGSITLGALTASGTITASGGTTTKQLDGAIQLGAVTTSGTLGTTPQFLSVFTPGFTLTANIRRDGVDATVLAPTLVASITDLRVGVNATVPAPTLTAWTGIYLSRTTPVASVSAAATVPNTLRMSASAPAATLSAWGGVTADLTVPAASLLASVVVPNTLRVGAVVPVAELSANALVGQRLLVSASVPVASCVAWTGPRLVAAVPAAGLYSVATFGGALRLSATVPPATLSAGGYSENVLRLSSDVPTVKRDNWLAVEATIAPASMFATAGQFLPVVRVGYALNLNNEAMTRYPAYPFIQIIRMGSKYYGIAEDGLHEIGGATDNGVPVPWAFEMCMSDFGQTEKKTVASAYLGGTPPATMNYTVRSGNTAAGVDEYVHTAPTTLRNHRQKFGLGRRDRFFAFGLESTSGPITIENIEFEIATTSRRIV